MYSWTGLLVTDISTSLQKSPSQWTDGDVYKDDLTTITDNMMPLSSTCRQIDNHQESFSEYNSRRWLCSNFYHAVYTRQVKLLLDVSFFLHHMSGYSQPQFLPQHFIILWRLLRLDFSKVYIHLEIKNNNITLFIVATTDKVEKGYIRELTQQRRRRLRKRHLKSEVALFQTVSRLFDLVHFVKCCPWIFSGSEL